MRKIKYRVWCKGTSDNLNFQKPRWISMDDFILNKYFHLFNSLSESPDFVLCQFTGILDKNGKEIYEGDIISGEFYDTEYHHAETIKHEIVFNNGAYNIASSNWHKPTLEIIGNIFENKKLLKQ